MARVSIDGLDGRVLLLSIFHVNQRPLTHNEPNPVTAPRKILQKRQSNLIFVILGPETAQYGQETRCPILFPAIGQ